MMLLIQPFGGDLEFFWLLSIFNKGISNNINSSKKMISYFSVHSFF